MRTKKLANHVILRVAVHAEASPKTVKRYCEGLPVRAALAERIERALRANGIAITEAERPP